MGEPDIDVVKTRIPAYWWPWWVAYAEYRRAAIIAAGAEGQIYVHPLF
jgi:hypothetical protein